MFDPIKFSQRFDAYFYWLGKFIHQFSQLESKLKALYCSGVLTSSAALSYNASDLTLFEAIKNTVAERADKGLPDCPYLTRAFPQVRKIAQMRNVLLHNGAQFREHLTFVLDLRKLVAGKEAPLLVDAKTLQSMCQDLATIEACLLAAMLGVFSDPINFESAMAELDIGPWHREMVAATGLDTLMASLDFRVLTEHAANLPWSFEPTALKSDQPPPNILRRIVRVHSLRRIRIARSV